MFGPLLDRTWNSLLGPARSGFGPSVCALGVALLAPPAGCESGGGTGGAGGTGTAGSSGSSASGGTGGTGACSAIRTFADGLNPTREVHVATSGSDGNSGTAASPVRTLGRALQLATPGTAVRIHAGTYAADTYRNALHGTATLPIWVGGAPGETRPVIEGGGQAAHFVRPRYVVLHDLEIRGQSANGLNVDDGAEYANADAARFVVFKNLYVHDVGSGGNQDCLKLSGLNDYWVLDSRFERCGGTGQGSAIDHVGCHRGLIARNVINDTRGTGIQSKGGSDDLEIRWNRFTNAGERAINMGGSTGKEFFRPPLSTSSPNFEARNIRVLANLFVGSVTPAAFVGCASCLFAHNTVVDPDNWIFRILQETVSDGTHQFLPAQNGRVIDNLIYFSRGGISTYVNVGANTRADTFTFRNNLWYAHDAPAQSTPTLPAPESGGVYGQNPALTSPSTADYSLSAASPAIGRGVRVSEVPGDITGRCYADPPAIGAYQR